MTAKWLDETELNLLATAFEKLSAGFHEHGTTPMASEEQARLTEILDRVACRLHNSFPFGDPLYAGQMLKPPHPIARLAYTLALWINANNHALDGGPGKLADGKRSRCEDRRHVRLALWISWPPVRGRDDG